MENRIPKRRYNGSSTNNRKEQRAADKFRVDNTLKVLEKKIDAGAAHTGLVIPCSVKSRKLPMS